MAATPPSDSRRRRRRPTDEGRWPGEPRADRPVGAALDQSHDPRLPRRPTRRGRCSWAMSSPEMRAYHDLEWGVPGARRTDAVRAPHPRGCPGRVVVVPDPGQARRVSPGLRRLRARRRGRVRRGRRGAAHEPTPRSSATGSRSSPPCPTPASSTPCTGPATPSPSLVWSFVSDVTVHNAWTGLGELPSSTAVSKAMSTELRRRGFRFVGPVTCYSTMQAAGLVNDHVTSCPRWTDLGGTVGSTT